MRFRMVLACLRENMECVRVCVRCRVCLPLVCLMIVFFFAVSRNRAVYAHWTQSQDAVASRVFGMMLLIPSTIEPQWVLLFVVAGMKTETSVFRLRGGGQRKTPPGCRQDVPKLFGVSEKLVLLGSARKFEFRRNVFFLRKGSSGPLFFSEEPPDHRGQATMLRHTQTNQAGCRRFPTWGRVGDGQDDTANVHVNNVSFPVFPRRPKTTPRRQDVWASCWVFRPCAQVFEAPGAINDGENMHPKVFPRQCQSPGNLLLSASRQ